MRAATAAEPPASTPTRSASATPSAPAPCRLDAPTTSVAVPAGWTARHTDGLLRLDRDGTASPPASAERTAAGVA
ncbi:MAG: hypothetical protein R3F59_20095 [Myxococcota bacterium]